MKETLPIFNMENEEMFPVNVHYHKGSFGKHIHTHWEISININNESIHNINSDSFFLSKYEMILIKPSDIHSISDGSSKKHTSLTFEISKHFIKAYCDNINSTLYQYLYDSPNIVTVLPKYIIDKIVDLITTTSSKNGRLSNQQNQSSIRNIVCLLLSHFIFKQYLNPVNKISEINSSIPLVSKFISIIEAEENLKLSFSEICEKLNYSKGHIIRIFKQNNIKTPNELLVHYKLSYSCRLLDTTNLNIEEICEMIGFSSYSYYNTIFKKEYGMSPSKYRKRVIKH